MEIAKLIDDNGYVVFFLDCWDTNLCLMGNLFSVEGWYKESDKTVDPTFIMFVSEIYFKWDMCTHWWFNGENYTLNEDDDRPAYYHLCGSSSIMNFLRSILFTCQVAKHYIERLDYEYDDLDFSILKGYTIEFEEIEIESDLAYVLDNFRDNKNKIHQ
jgi:hypothetical protein